MFIIVCSNIHKHGIMIVVIMSIEYLFAIIMSVEFLSKKSVFLRKYSIEYIYF